MTQVVAMVDLDFGSVPDYKESGVGPAPGGFLCVNDDDDNSNGTPDKDDVGPTLGEDDLMPLTITADGAQSGILTLSVLSGGQRIKVWENADRSMPVTLPASWNILGLPKNFTTTLYVEGVAPSVVTKDVELMLDVLLQTGDTCEDHVKLTVFSVTMNPSPEPIPAATAWPAMPDYSFSQITVEWIPPTIPGLLSIAELITNGYNPPNNGTLVQIDATQWLYDAFDEPQTEIHPRAGAH